MIKNRIYYMLLGLGLGIIISSSLNIVFNKTETVEYTDEQIKEKAKDLGMISIKENIEKNDKEKAEEKIKKEKEEKEDLESETQESEETYSEIEQAPKEIKTELEVETQIEQPQPSQVQYRSIVINELDTANNIINELVSKGIVEDRQTLRRIVNENKLQTKFISGTYNLKQKSSVEEVLRKLIKEKELINVKF